MLKKFDIVIYSIIPFILNSSRINTMSFDNGEQFTDDEYYCSDSSPKSCVSTPNINGDNLVNEAINGFVFSSPYNEEIFSGNQAVHGLTSSDPLDEEIFSGNQAVYGLTSSNPLDEEIFSGNQAVYGLTSSNPLDEEIFMGVSSYSGHSISPAPDIDSSLPSTDSDYDID